MHVYFAAGAARRAGDPRLLRSFFVISRDLGLRDSEIWCLRDPHHLVQLRTALQVFCELCLQLTTGFKNW